MHNRNKWKREKDRGVVVAVTTWKNLIAAWCSNFASSLIVLASKRGTKEYTQNNNIEGDSRKWKGSERRCFCKIRLNYPYCNFPKSSLFSVAGSIHQGAKQAKQRLGLFNSDFHHWIYKIYLYV